MERSRWLVIGLTATSALVAAILLFRTGGEPGLPIVRFEAGAQAGSSPLAHSGPAGGGVVAEAAVAASTPGGLAPPLLASVQAALSARDVLPHYVRLLQARAPGSYGLARELYDICYGAMTSTVSYIADRDGIERVGAHRDPKMQRPEVMARRDAAVQEITRRCEPLLQTGLGTQFELNDVHAQRRQLAFKALGRNNQAMLFGAPGAELVSQGLLFTLAQDAIGNPDEPAVRYFEGKALTAADEITAFRLALAWARGDIQLGPSPGPDNLYALMSCADGSSCAGDWRMLDARGLLADSKVQAQAQQLLPRIKAALEANNLDAFRPPKP
jgi:hypothetical protein